MTVCTKWFQHWARTHWARAVTTPVVTSVVVSPSSFTVAAGDTQQLTAQSYDQYGDPIADSHTWMSSATGQATVDSSGLVTGVSAGSPTITATSVSVPSKTGTSAATVTGGVTSVTVSYNGQAAPILARTGQTYTLVAKDQSGNTLTGGTWSSSDPTNCPINSSTGVISPNAGATGATLTYLHSDGVHSGTITATVLKASTVIASESVSYVNDAALRAAIRTTVTTGTYVTPPPTGGAGVLYQDGVNEGLITLDATRPFMGRQTLLMTFPGNEASYGVLAANATGHTTSTRVWMLVVKRYDAGFTSQGVVGGPNTGIAASYKDGPFVNWSNGDGRAGLLYSNTTDIDLEALVQVSGTGVGGPNETPVSSVTTEWTNQNFIVDILLYEARGISIMSERCWRFNMGANPLTTTLAQSTVQAPMNAGVAVGRLSGLIPFGMNYNQIRNPGQVLYKNVAYWEYVDGATYGDPYGLLNDSTTPSLSGISGGTMAHGSTNQTITLTGTNLTANCYPQFSNAKIYPQSITQNGTSMTVVVNVDNTATPGAGTVAVHNACSQQTSGTQSVTVT